MNGEQITDVLIESRRSIRLIDKEKEDYMRYCAASEKQLISEFVNKLDWIQEDFYNEDEENRLNIIKKEYQEKLK